MGHKRPETFERNYIAYTSFSDIQSLSQGMSVRLGPLTALARSSSRRDIAAPLELPAEEVAKVDQSEELKVFDEELLTADHDTAIQIKDAKRYARRKLLTASLKAYRKDWFEQRDDENGRTNNDPYILDIPPHGLEAERRRTAAALFGSIPSNNQTALVEDLVAICLHTGAKKRLTGPAEARRRVRQPQKYTEIQYFRGSEPSNGHCRFCNFDLSSMDEKHQVAHANQCFSHISRLFSTIAASNPKRHDIFGIICEIHLSVNGLRGDVRFALKINGSCGNT